MGTPYFTTGSCLAGCAPTAVCALLPPALSAIAAKAIQIVFVIARFTSTSEYVFVRLSAGAST